MIRCGIGLLNALEALAKQNDEETAACAGLVASDLASGLQFSEALKRLPETFSESYIGVIKAAEESGTLEASLEHLSRIIHRQYDTRRALSSAMFYPLFLVISCGLLVAIMLFFVFPMVISVTVAANVEIPAMTAMLMKVSSPKFGLAALLLLGVFITLLIIVKRTPRWREPLQTRLERNNPFGRFYVRVQLLESLRQFSALLSNGVDILRAVKLASGVSSSCLSLSQGYESVKGMLSLGVPLSEALEEQECFPQMFVGIIAVSADVGNTPELVDYYCEQLEEELDLTLRSFSSIIEPVMMGVLGTVIGAILIAAFMPIYNLVQV